VGGVIQISNCLSEGPGKGVSWLETCFQSKSLAESKLVKPAGREGVELLSQPEGPPKLLTFALIRPNNLPFLKSSTGGFLSSTEDLLDNHSLT
jgi:hypothetical protein